MVDPAALREALAYLTKEFGPSANWPEGDPEWVEYQPLAAAARELLRLMETAETMWWCLEHGASFQQEAEPTPPRWGCWYMENDGEAVRDCRMVQRLVWPAVLTRRDT